MPLITSWALYRLQDSTLSPVRCNFGLGRFSFREYLLLGSEVSLYFNHHLYRGNRVSKVSSFDLEAFASPNFPALVDGEHP